MTTSKNNNQSTSTRKLYTAPALEKGLDILELLASEVNGLSIGEITTRLDKTVGELFRMLVVLEQRGYVELPENSDQYRLTIKMFGLANKYPPIKRLNAIAAQALHSLSYIIEQSCHLVIYYQGKGHVIVHQEAPTERVFSVRLGAEAPLANTCSGHILLAFSSNERQKIMLSKIPSYHTKPNKKSFKELLNLVKEQGFQTLSSEQTPGIRDIGYPVFDYTGEVVASLVVPFLGNHHGQQNFDITEAQLKIKETASEISQKLGYEED